MRPILTTLNSEEVKRIVDAQAKLKEDGNKENYQKVITAVTRSACLRCKRDVGEVELTDDGKIVLRYERMSEHDLRVAILRELEIIRSAVGFQAEFLQNQLMQAAKQQEAAKANEAPKKKEEPKK